MKNIIVFSLLIINFSLLIPCNAQYTVLHNFAGKMGTLHGITTAPNGSLTLSGKLLYGMTGYGGAYNYGCVFSIDTNGNGYKDLYDFDSANGAWPHGSLTYASGLLYGMTTYGGANNLGCIFSIDTNGNGYKDILDFNGSNGAEPYGSLTLSGKVLYGMTEDGGSGGGCVFSIDTDGSKYKDLLNFTGVPTGQNPFGSLTLSGKVLYGMTWAGGAGGQGCIFSIDTNGNEYKDLYDFVGFLPPGGAAPFGSLTLSGNKLYGMTYSNGFSGPGQVGNIFSIDTNGGYKDLLDFNGIDGAYPLGSLTLSGGMLYGMTFDAGDIFSIDTNGSGFRDLYYFRDYSTGNDPGGDLTLSGNMLYGMTTNGGTDSVGVIFKFNYVTAGVNNLTVSNGIIKVYPNPNNGQFTLSLSNVNTVCNVEIYNVLGEKIYLETLPQSQSNNTISLTGKPNGVYLYRVTTENGMLAGEGEMIIQR